MGQCKECGAMERVKMQLEGHRELVECPECHRCREISTEKKDREEE